MTSPEDTNITTIQCPIPTYEPLTTNTNNSNSDNLTIVSQASQIKENNLASFSGGVTLHNKNQTIKADTVEVNRESSQIKANGSIHFQNQGIDIFASDLSSNKSTKETSMNNTSYQLNNSAGHGNAKEIKVNDNGDVSLIDSNFTTCYGENPDWTVKASEINFSNDDKQVEAYHARFAILDIPVMYLPYMRFPTGKHRQTGFLYPSIGSSNTSGVVLETPYYINIAENMDATLTPRYMSKRGTQLLSEYRYLVGEQYGELHVEYLNKDDELKNSNDSRYLARLEHVGTFSERFRAYIDYTRISDDNYLVDLGSEEYSSSDAYLYQVGELSYFGDTWRSTIKLQDFEVLGDHTASYQTLPHLEFSMQQPLALKNATFDLYSEITQFKNPHEDQPEAQRYHVEAGFSYPVSFPSWFVNSEIKVLQTYYDQSNLQENSALDKSVDRTLPKIRLHGGMNFDREMDFIGNGYTQTLEPQLQYLYIPEKNQNNIGVYDTTTLQDDYNGLFRDRRYSGLDRIAQANQYSWGITSRILDAKNNEKLRFSIGRISYLNNSNDNNDVSDHELEAENEFNTDKSALAAELDLKINRSWKFGADMQYNTDTNQTQKSQINAAYNFGNNQIIELNHRYTRDVSGIRLEQASVLTSFNINPYWQFVGRMTQDLQEKHSIESYAGVQYSSCCWGVRFIFHRHINTNLDDNNDSDENRDPYESGFKLEFVYNGLSGGSSSSDVTEMFNSSIFGYKQPYYLNN